MVVVHTNHLSPETVAIKPLLQAITALYLDRANLYGILEPDRRGEDGDDQAFNMITPMGYREQDLEKINQISESAPRF